VCVCVCADALADLFSGRWLAGKAATEGGQLLPRYLVPLLDEVKGVLSYELFAGQGSSSQPGDGQVRDSLQALSAPPLRGHSLTHTHTHTHTHTTHTTHTQTLRSRLGLRGASLAAGGPGAGGTHLTWFLLYSP
jgi:hypothetical protein